MSLEQDRRPLGDYNSEFHGAHSSIGYIGPDWRRAIFGAGLNKDLRWADQVAGATKFEQAVEAAIIPNKYTRPMLGGNTPGWRGRTYNRNGGGSVFLTGLSPVFSTPRPVLSPVYTTGTTERRR